VKPVLPAVLAAFRTSEEESSTLLAVLPQKAAISATVMICAGSVADDRSMVACVRKTGEHKAMIDMEKRGQVQYSIEGDLVQRNYKVMKSGAQVAQVPSLQIFAGCYASQLAGLSCFPFVTCLLYYISAHHCVLQHNHCVTCAVACCGPLLYIEGCSRPQSCVTQVMRDDNARAAVTSKHSYCLQVAPHTDCALMIAAAMAVEDMFHPK
jgi:uncharacterized protein YxjI